jgi:hypothetical protein
MNEIYVVNVGFQEPTIIYRLVPKKVAELNGASIAEIMGMLHSFDAHNLIVDSGSIQANEQFLMNGFNLLIVEGKIT